MENNCGAYCIVRLLKEGKTCYVRTTRRPLFAKDNLLTLERVGDEMRFWDSTGAMVGRISGRWHEELAPPHLVGRTIYHRGYQIALHYNPNMASGKDDGTITIDPSFYHHLATKNPLFVRAIIEHEVGEQDAWKRGLRGGACDNGAGAHECGIAKEVGFLAKRGIHIAGYIQSIKDVIKDLSALSNEYVLPQSMLQEDMRRTLWFRVSRRLHLSKLAGSCRFCGEISC
jgi:hypothetical protein